MKSRYIAICMFLFTCIISSNMVFGKRQLGAFVNPSNVQISGNGTSSFLAKEDVHITIATYGCSNNALSTGGGNFILEVTAYDTSSNTISVTNTTFADNSDGTYTATFEVSQEGSIDYSIYVSDACTVCAEYYNNFSLVGTAYAFCNHANINFNYGTGLVSPDMSDFVSAKFTGTIIAPETNTYTFILDHNDGARLIIDGSPLIDQFTAGTASHSDTISLVAGTQYQIVVDYFEYTGSAHLILKWSYGSVSQQVVSFTPSLDTFEKEVGSGPYTATVLAPLCGNGVIDNAEECDDGNYSSADGCDDDCVIEDDYICVGGSASTSSTCSECVGTSYPNASKDTCLPGSTIPTPTPVESPESTNEEHANESVSSGQENMAYTVIIVTLVGLSISILNSILTNSSVTGLFGFINNLQMIIIIPLIGTGMSGKVIDFITYFVNFMISFDQILQSGSYYNYDAFGIGYPQDHWYLNLIDFDSGSGFINIQDNIVVFIITLMIAILINLKARCSMKKQQPNFCDKFVIKLNNLLIFDTFVRLVIESYVLYCLASFYELRHFDNSNSGRTTSGGISAIIAAVMILFLVISIILWVKSFKSDDPIKKSYFKNFFSGLKPSPKHRSYVPLFLAKRLILVGVVTYFDTFGSKINLYIFVTTQTIFLIMVIWIRFHDSQSQNINEVINEVVYTLLLVILIPVYDKSDWSPTYENIYLSTITVNCIIYGIVCGYALVHNSIKKLISRKRNYRVGHGTSRGLQPQQQRNETSQVMNKSEIRNQNDKPDKEISISSRNRDELEIENSIFQKESNKVISDEAQEDIDINSKIGPTVNQDLKLENISEPCGDESMAKLQKSVY